MSLIVNCKFCGERISLRKMPHGKHVPFDANTDDQHSCQKSKRINEKPKKKTLDKTKNVTSKKNIDDKIIDDDFIIETTATTDNNIFKNETLDNLKNEIEVETKEQKIKNSTFLIIGLVLIILILLFK